VVEDGRVQPCDVGVVACLDRERADARFLAGDRAAEGRSLAVRDIRVAKGGVELRRGAKYLG
jgi:hypothetical protein